MRVRLCGAPSCPQASAEGVRSDSTSSSRSVVSAMIGLVRGSGIQSARTTATSGRTCWRPAAAEWRRWSCDRSFGQSGAIAGPRVRMAGAETGRRPLWRAHRAPIARQPRARKRNASRMTVARSHGSPLIVDSSGRKLLRVGGHHRCAKGEAEQALVVCGARTSRAASDGRRLKLMRRSDGLKTGRAGWASRCIVEADDASTGDVAMGCVDSAPRLASNPHLRRLRTWGQSSTAWSWRSGWRSSHSVSVIDDV